MQKDLVKGVVYSQFNEKTGPEAVAWDPNDVEIEVRDLVSMKSINMLAGEGGLVPESLAILPFPSKKLKGLIKALEIKDKTRRGGAIDSSLTLLFDEADDIIFYKYIDNFDKIFNQSVTTIKALYETDPSSPKIKDELLSFHQNVLDTLNDLCAAEFACNEQEAFPTTEAEVKADSMTYLFKIVVCGDPSVGKTSTVLRFTDKAFRRTYIPTVGVNISEKQVNYDKENINIEFVIWDIAGQAKFQMMRKHFYSGSDGILLLFDLTRPETFHDIKRWYSDIRTNLGTELHGLILANKNDLLDQRQVSKDQITKVAEELSLEAVETSALTGENVDAAFAKLGKLLIQQKSGTS